MKQIEVKLFGLNELGVRELNEHYKHNINFYSNQGWKPFELGQTFHPGIYWAKKRFKQLKSFYKLGLDNHVGYFDCLQMILNEDGTISQNHGPYFLLQIKHFVHKVYEVEVIETFTEVSL